MPRFSVPIQYDTTTLRQDEALADAMDELMGDVWQAGFDMAAGDVEVHDDCIVWTAWEGGSDE